MSAQGRSETGGHETGGQESDWQRRRRLAAVFGDVLPETTSDERDAGQVRDGAGDGELGKRGGPSAQHAAHPEPGLGVTDRQKRATHLAAINRFRNA